MAANVNREANLRGGCGAPRGATAASNVFLVPGQTSPAAAVALTPRKPSNNLFGPFRPLGNLQTTCLSLSDPSETFKQPVWAFPTPRKPSNNLFGPFRPLGNLQTTCLSLSDPSGRLRPPAKFAGYGLLRCSAGIPDAPRGGCGVAASNVFLVPGQTSPAAAAALTPRKGGKHSRQGVPRPSRLSLPPVIWYRDAWRAIRYHV